MLAPLRRFGLLAGSCAAMDPPSSLADSIALS